MSNEEAAPDIPAPVSGKIHRLNEQLTTTPSLLNTLPETEGWIGQIKLSEQAAQELAQLMTKDEYKQFCEQEDESFRMAMDIKQEKD
ncbi:hypothetical protein BGZ94_003782 [Podila epigama]|nr:hypothetical protein BGZ94_003782 [Podila epigama]